MKIVVLDFETYWDSKNYTLSKMGPVSYIRDDRFSAQLLSFIVTDSSTMTYDNVRVAEHDKIPAVLSALRLDAPGTMTVAHNGNGFDFLVLSEIYHVIPWLAVDTMCMERWTGVSRMQNESLKSMAKFFKCGEKAEGIVISDGRRWPDDFSSEERLAFAQYCRNDTEQCFLSFREMLPYMTADALLFSSVTAKMACNPVLRLDDDMLTAYLNELADKVTKARMDINKLFMFKTDEDFLKAIRSAPAFVRMLELLGRKPPMKYSVAKSETKKKKLEAEGKRNLKEEDYAVYTPALAKSDLDFTAMASDADERVALLVRTRLENNSSIQRSRAETFHALAKSGKPMPVMLNAFRAHTSRYTAGNSEGSSDKLNLQNLSKRDPSQLTLRKAVQAPEGMALVACDSSQIEARILAYVADETELVDAFRRGADPYADLAEKVFQIPSEEIHKGAKSGDKKLKAYRNVGKTGILSAGYGVGWRKYADTLLRQGVRLSSDIDQHYEMAHHAHNVYRASNPSIVNFWDTCQAVIKALYLGYCGEFGGPNDNIFRYGMEPVCGRDKVPTIEGPNGYALRYYGLTCQESEENGRVEFYYVRPKGKSELKTKIYGGALTENLCQYLAFALLQWQACRMTEQGIRLIANIHDSFLAICPEEYAERTKAVMESCMSSVPDWLKGFPVACEAEIGKDYCIA
uniref:DNA POLYMERASE n=1 Tax=Podoviridae sp. ct2iq11 TaxID=2827720 RepID=A0A8S5TPJ1_9CAUD|nr:MAG TPA: DNA POLYMERASE [Podoviridae sp. ct2iq11]